MPTQRPRHPYPHPEPPSARTTATSLDAEWEASTLPDKQEWKDVYETLFNGAGSATYLRRAERLDKYDFTPSDLREACENPRAVVTLNGPDDFATEEPIEALLALTHEASIYYSTATSIVMSRRDDYARRLQDFGWAQTQIAALLGMTKQRVSAFLKKPKAKFGVALPPTKDPGGGGEAS